MNRLEKILNLAFSGFVYCVDGELTFDPYYIGRDPYFPPADGLKSDILYGHTTNTYKPSQFSQLGLAITNMQERFDIERAILGFNPPQECTLLFTKDHERGVSILNLDCVESNKISTLSDGYRIGHFISFRLGKPVYIDAEMEAIWVYYQNTGVLKVLQWEGSDSRHFKFLLSHNFTLVNGQVKLTSKSSALVSGIRLN